MSSKNDDFASFLGIRSTAKNRAVSLLFLKVIIRWICKGLLAHSDLLEDSNKN